MILLGLIGFACLAVFLDAVAAHAFTPDSDGATVVLEGHAIAQGHLLLHKWGLSLDSFWTVDALWYLVGVLVAGISPVLPHAVPAAIAAATIVLGAVIAVEQRTGGAAVAAAGTVVAILAFPSHAFAIFFLRGPLHVGTALWCLISFFALRKGRLGRGWAVGVVFLAAGLLGDLQTLALGVVPVALTGLVAAGRTRDWRKGLPLVAAAAASVVLAEVVRKVARTLGTFTIAAANPTSGLHQMLGNVGRGIREGVALMGVGSAYYGADGVPKALGYVHLLAILVVFAALVGAAWSTVHGAARGRPTVVGTNTPDAFLLDDLLVFATFSSPAAFVLLAASSDPSYARYLTAGLIFGAVLAGRVVGRVAQDLEWRALGRVLAGTGLAATGCYAAASAITVSRPAPVAPAAALAGFLEAHHLHHGIGAYWSASVTTVQSHGAVEVRPVVSPNGSRLYRYERNSAAYWYREPFRFLVYQPSQPWGAVDATTARNCFGPPAATYDVVGYTVMVWNRTLHVPPLPNALTDHGGG